jgi:hypothetical protein
MSTDQDRLRVDQEKAYCFGERVRYSNSLPIHPPVVYLVKCVLFLKCHGVLLGIAQFPLLRRLKIDEGIRAGVELLAGLLSGAQRPLK